MTELQRARQQGKDPTKGRSNPAKDREEVADRGEMLAGRRAMQGPGKLEETTEEERAELASEGGSDLASEPRQR